jgi:hypothetical protein
MRASLALALVLPVVLTGCPAVLSDWSISGRGDDAGADAKSGSISRGGGSTTGGSTGAGASTSSSSGGSSGSTSGGSSGADSGPRDGASEAAPVCEALQGPTALGTTNAGAVGITFHSKANATLVKFVFHNGGYADTVSLEDGVSCSVIDSMPIPVHIQTYTASVSWTLVANKSYRLVSSKLNQYNETQAVVAPGGWPWTDGQNLVVDDCAGGADHCASGASSLACGYGHQYWFNFTDLEICSDGSSRGGATSDSGTCNSAFCPTLGSGIACCFASNRCGADFGNGCVPDTQMDGGR